MNWKLIFQLSLFGLAMGVATVFLIPSTIEPIFWLIIFAISAYVIASRCSGRYFMHGFSVSIVNSVASHPKEAAMMTSMPLPDQPRLMMAIVGPVIGVCSGVVLGLFAAPAAKLMGLRSRPSPILKA